MELIDAAYFNDIDRVRELLDSGVNPNTKNNWGQTPLMLALYKGDTEIVRLLLQHGADPNSKNRDGGDTLLMDASRLGRIDIVRLFLENGADPSITNNWGESAYDITRYRDIKNLIQKHMDLQKMQRPLQNLAFMKYFLDRDDLDIDTASKIFSNVYSYNHDVGRRIRDEQLRNMILEEENNRIADYLNTIEQYGMGKCSKGKRSKKLSKKSSKKRSSKKKSKTKKKY